MLGVTSIPLDISNGVLDAIWLANDPVPKSHSESFPEQLLVAEVF